MFFSLSFFLLFLLPFLLDRMRWRKTPNGASDKICTLQATSCIINWYPWQLIPSIFSLSILESPVLCKVNWIHIFSLRQGTSAIKKSNGCKGDEPLQKEPSKITNGVLIKNQRELGMPIDDRVAIKIQTAFRAYVVKA